MGKMSRDKGKRGELEVAKLLMRHGFTARRGVQYHGGPDSPDVTCEELDAKWHIEVKRVESLSLYKALEQAAEDCDFIQEPLVFHRRNDKPWVVIMDAEEFIRLLKEAGR